MNRFVFCLAAVLLVLTGPAPAQTQPQALIPIRVNATPIDLNGPVFYAQELGFFKNHGLDVHIQLTFAGVEATAEGMLAGSVDVGSANTATLAEAHVRGIDFRFFAPAGLFSDKVKPTEVVTVLKTSPYHTAADLNGKTVTTGSIRSMLHAAMMAWTDKHGGNSKTLQFVEIPFPQMDAALVAHRIDAAVLTEPYASAASDARVIGSAEDGVASTFMTLGWYSTAAWLNAHPDAAVRFIAAIHDAAVWGNSHHDESAAILSKYSKIPVNVAGDMGRSVYGLTLDPKLIQAPLDVTARYGFIDHAFPATDIMWFPPAQK